MRAYAQALDRGDNIVVAWLDSIKGNETIEHPYAAVAGDRDIGPTQTHLEVEVNVREVGVGTESADRNVNPENDHADTVSVVSSPLPAMSRDGTGAGDASLLNVNGSRGVSGSHVNRGYNTGSSRVYRTRGMDAFQRVYPVVRGQQHPHRGVRRGFHVNDLLTTNYHQHRRGNRGDFLNSGAFGSRFRGRDRNFAPQRNAGPNTRFLDFDDPDAYTTHYHQHRRGNRGDFGNNVALRGRDRGYADRVRTIPNERTGAGDVRGTENANRKSDSADQNGDTASVVSSPLPAIYMSSESTGTHDPSLAIHNLAIKDEVATDGYGASSSRNGPERLHNPPAQVAQNNNGHNGAARPRFKFVRPVPRPLPPECWAYPWSWRPDPDSE